MGPGPAAQNGGRGVPGTDAVVMAVRMKFKGAFVVKRFVAVLLIALVGLPGTVIAATGGQSCSMPQGGKAPACAYCAPAKADASVVPTLKTNCCRFLPRPESVPAQAGSIGATPKPLHAPDFASTIPMSDVPSISAAFAAREYQACGASPPQSPPTRTTHLLL